MHTHELEKLDQKYLWHPFTQMKDWLRSEPIVLVEGHGAVLKDVHGREYLDANSSIWTNLHGHAHPAINRAIARQSRKVAHTSALGFANEPASLLGRDLVTVANRPWLGRTPDAQLLAPAELKKVFYSDNGSTATEVALKLAYECARRTGVKKPSFLSLQGAYHGDTIGAVSLGHIDLFHSAYSGLLFKTDKVSAPYCYRCAYNRAKPERTDARNYPVCNQECLSLLSRKFERRAAAGRPYSAFMFEPLMQGAAGMIAQPPGWLARAASTARHHGAMLIADEVMTGFGRTGIGNAPDGVPNLFACHQEGVQPDFMALAKGLTGGYVPMAATLTTQRVFDAFLGEYEDFKTFFHGHSFTGNQIGSSAALASLGLLGEPRGVSTRAKLEQSFAGELESLWSEKCVGDVRRVGLVAGVELVRNWETKEPFALEERVGIRVCKAMAKRGVLTRPVGNVIVLMPPYCTTKSQVRIMVGALLEAVQEVCRGGRKSSSSPKRPTEHAAREA